MKSFTKNINGVSEASQPPSEYQHEPLKSEQHIRVLRFQQSRSNGPIRFTLHQISLDGVASESSSYNAVSYTWASDLPDVDVLCNGQRLRVTGNCEAALRRFQNRRMRDPAKKALWIDSICIRQNDIKERNHQVSIMGEIYEKAHCVLIWLGPSTRDTEYVFKQYRHQCSRSSYFWSLLKALHIYVLKSPEGDLGSVNSMLAVSNIPWFSRVWTVQEAAFARKPIAFCGSDTASFHTLSTVLIKSSTLIGFGSSPLVHKTHQIFFRYYYSGRAVWGINISRKKLFESIAAVASYEATEPRDKVFAICGLLKKFGITLPPPDYAASLADVYWQATKVLLLACPEILYLVTGFPSPHLEDVPSWVPDYSDESFRFASPTWNFWNNGTAKASRQVVAFPGPNGRLFQLEGRIFDVICNVSKFKIWDTESLQPFHEAELLEILEPHSHRIIDTLQDWAFMARKTTLYVNGHPWQEAFLKTICSRSIGFRNRNQHVATNAKEWCSILLLDDAGAGLHVLDNQWPLTASRAQHSVPPILKQFCSATVAIQNGISQQYISLLLAIDFNEWTSEILLSLSDNTFFITEMGQMGIGPCSIKEGDKVLCIPGFELPLTVRPIGERFTLVSAAYVHGTEAMSDNTEQLSKFILE